jgi:hypothetical protein
MDVGVTINQIFQPELHIPHQPAIYMLHGHVFVIYEFEDSASFHSKRAVPRAPERWTTIRGSD